MRIVARTPLGMETLGRLHLGHLVFGVVACGFAAATYAIAEKVAAQPQSRSAPPAVVGGPLTPAARPLGRAAPVKATTPPPAAEFARLFLGVTNRYAREHGDPARLGDADCVQASSGHYMCSYAITRPNGPSECRIMQAVWTPEQASSFTVTLAGRSERCGSLREALRSLK